MGMRLWERFLCLVKYVSFCGKERLNWNCWESNAYFLPRQLDYFYKINPFMHYAEIQSLNLNGLHTLRGTSDQQTTRRSLWSQHQNLDFVLFHRKLQLTQSMDQLIFSCDFNVDPIVIQFGGLKHPLKYVDNAFKFTPRIK